MTRLHTTTALTLAALAAVTGVTAAATLDAPKDAASVAFDPSDLPAPLTDADFLHDGAPRRALEDLGRALFFDPILSGNRNISCGTCHDPALGSSDGLALGIGEGGRGAGPDRRAEDGVTGRVPRNATGLWNIGARAYDAMFHDGRLEPDPAHTFPSGFWSPAREALPEGLDSLLAAQAMFPVLSPVEMAGQKGENPVATAVAEDRLDDAWDLLAARLAATPAYVALFAAAFDDVDAAGDITFVHAARALAAFQTTAFRSDGSPFDAVLRTGDASHLSAEARAGMALFYGDAGCAACHSGPLLTDHDFHAVAMPQIGPGKGHGADTSYWAATGFGDRLEDEGRFRVSFEAGDLFAFRTPSLRNVELTAPYGHAGAYPTLREALAHHLDPAAALAAYEAPELPPLDAVIEATGRGSALIFQPLNPERAEDWAARDSWVQSRPALRGRIAEASDLAPVALTEAAVDRLLAFLAALTDPTAKDRGDLVPRSVPSGLPPQPATRIGEGG